MVWLAEQAQKKKDAMSQSKWSWNFIRGSGWALSMTAAALFGVKDALVRSVVDGGGNHSPLLVVFGVAALALWLGGLRRIPADQATQEADIRARVGNLQNPTDKS